MEHNQAVRVLRNTVVSNNILTLRNPHYILMNRDCLPSQIRLITHYPTVYIFTNPIHDRIHFPPHRHTQSNRNEIPRNTDNISLAAQSHQFAPKQNLVEIAGFLVRRTVPSTST